MNRHRHSLYPPFLIPLLTFTLLVLCVITTVVAVRRFAPDPLDQPPPLTDGQGSESGDAGTGSAATDQQGNPTAPAYTDITLLSTGDIMFHNNNVLAGLNPDTGAYSYHDIFSYLTPIVSRYDYAVANLETPLCGPSLPYSQAGSVIFNAPDAAADALRTAGFDMMLFANNHTNDGKTPGLIRTVNTLKDRGFDVIGAKAKKEDRAWRIVNIKGVRVGMLNYTNDGTFGYEASGTLNGMQLNESRELVNVFYLNDLDGFYARVRQDLSEMKQAGVDFTVFYLHFGTEYVITPHEKQTEIAKALCDLGVDAIVGSHPHVIQPMEVLTSSTDPTHKTVCFYSLGNFLSNQHRESLSESYCKGNNKEVENGLMTVFTIRKYRDGTTVLADIELIPTWVHHYPTADGVGEYEYRIIPLEQALKNPSAFGLHDSSYGTSHATHALSTTTALLSPTLAAWKSTLTLPPLPA